MQIGKVYISKISKLWNSFVLGIEINWGDHFHEKTSDDPEINEFYINVNFLFWQFDISINKN